MSDDVRRLTTDAERERFAVARQRGGLCAACGRVLADDEPVYIGQIVLERKPLATPGAWRPQRSAYRDAPLGRECASPAFVARTAGREPEPCEHCGRPVYYEIERAGRRRTVCSRRCHSRANKAAR